MTAPTISAKQVKELRDRTGAGMMECKKALEENNGDIDAAVEHLRVRLGDKALKVGGREATEGAVASYIHGNGKVGVLVEVDCNTDFVARNEDFVAFARDIALHVAASPATRYVSEDEIPQADKDAELRIFEQQAADKPEHIRPKIAEGKLKAWMNDHVFDFPTMMAVCNVLFWILAAIAGGWVAMVIARRREAVWVLAAIVGGYLLYQHLYAEWANIPAWYNLVVALSAIPAVLLGGTLAGRNARAAQHVPAT